MRRSPGQVRLPTLFGLLAQLAEHLTVNQGVAGSSPAGTAMFGAIDELVKSSAFHAEECEFEPRWHHHSLAENCTARMRPA